MTLQAGGKEKNDLKVSHYYKDADRAGSDGFQGSLKERKGLRHQAEACATWEDAETTGRFPRGGFVCP